MWRAAGSSRWTTSPSIKSAAKQLGLSESFLWRILHGRRSAKDYELKFAPAASLKGEKWRNVRDPKRTDLLQHMGEFIWKVEI